MIKIFEAFAGYGQSVNVVKLIFKELFKQMELV